MTLLVDSDLPTIYADINVFRYVAYGEMTVTTPERFRWVYSHVHLDEIRNSGNRDALEGMRQLQAVEIESVLNEHFQSTGTVVLHDYVNVDTRYQEHLDAVSGFEDAGNSLGEVFLRLLGGDNFRELAGAPEMLTSEVDRLTHLVDAALGEELHNKAHRVAIELTQGIKQHLTETRSLDEVRSAVGLTSETRNSAARSPSPIDSLWDAIKGRPEGLDKDQLFGLKPIPGVQAATYSQDCSVAGAYAVLNVLGVSPDKGLAKRDRLNSTVSDSQHVGMASYCNALLSGDRRLCDKANAIYIHIRAAARALHFDYKPGGFTLGLRTNWPDT